jgi:hypothetical protein
MGQVLPKVVEVCGRRSVKFEQRAFPKAVLILVLQLKNVMLDAA